MDEDPNKLVLPDRGTLVAGRYRVVDTVGRGGCGVVFEARDERMGRDVALKVLSPDAARRVTSLARRFEREIDLVRRLEHPNIVRLYDFSRAEDRALDDDPGAQAPHWMAMELVRGVELRHAVDPDTGRMHPARVHAVILQLLSGLTAAHQQGIVHRDLKPNNIMLCSLGADQDVVKILDFGIGRTLSSDDTDTDDITHTEGTLLGTPRYMAPEVLLKKPPGPAADVYAVGLMMLELLTGRRAVEGKDVYEVVAQQLSAPVVIPDWLRDSPFGTVLSRATNKAPTQRYPTALEFHEALREARVTDALVEAFRAQDEYEARIATDRLQRADLPTREVHLPLADDDDDAARRGLDTGPTHEHAPADEVSDLSPGDPLASEPLLGIDAPHTPVDLVPLAAPQLALEAATETTTRATGGDAHTDDDLILAHALELPTPLASDDVLARPARPHLRHPAAAMRVWLRGLPALLATALIVLGIAGIRWSHAEPPAPSAPPDPIAWSADTLPSEPPADATTAEPNAPRRTVGATVTRIATWLDLRRSLHEPGAAR